MKRRSILASVGLGAVTTVSGCSGGNDYESPNALAAPSNIVAINMADEDTNLEFEIFREDERAYSDTVSLDGVDRDPGESHRSAEGTNIYDDALGEITDYTVTATLPDDLDSDSVSSAEYIDERDFEYDIEGYCYEIRISIGPRESPTSEAGGERDEYFWPADDVSVSIDTLREDYPVKEYVTCDPDRYRIGDV